MRRRSRRCRRRPPPRRIDTVTPFGQVTVSCVEVDVEAVLGEQAAGRRWWLGLAARLDVLVVECCLELAGPVGGVAVDLRSGASRLRFPAFFSAFVAGVSPMRSSIRSAATVASPDVAGRDDRVGDDLAVGIDRDVALVAVEAAGLGLVAVTGLRIDGGDHPIRGDPPSDAEHAVVALVEVLADHGRQQLGRLGHRLGASSRPSSTPRQANPSGPAHRPARPGAAGRPSRSAACRATSSRHRAPTRARSSAASSRSATVSNPRIAERIIVTVSFVATASYNGVESSTRR